MRRHVVKPRAAGMRRRIVYALLLVGAVTALAPTIIAATGLHNQFLHGVLPEEAGTLTAGSASFGWFSSTELKDVRVHTPEGEVLLEIAALSLDRTVLDLVGDGTDLGTIRVAQPEVHITATARGSNLEAFISRLLAAQDDPSAPISCTMQTERGSVQVVDERSGTTATIAIEECACQIVQGELTSLRATLTDPSAAPQPGTFTASLAPGGNATRQLDLTARNWPIGTASFVLRRLLEDAEATGQLTLDATTTWSADTGLESTGSATVADIALRAAPLHTDRLELDELRVPWKIRMGGERLLVDELSVTSGLGRVTARGELSTHLLSDNAGNLPAAEILRLPLAVSGSLDLARLAAMLPDTLRIKQGVVVSSGRAEFELESRPGDPVHNWRGTLAVSDLTARDHTRTLRWNRPVVVAASVRHDGKWAVESLTCQSDFLQLAAAGDREQMTAQADFDLTRLAADLGQFVDIADWHLGGHGSVRAQWRPGASGGLRTSVSGSIQALRFVDSRGQLWQEPSLQLDADMVLRLPEGKNPLTLERGSQWTLNTAKDRAFVKLDEPLVWPANGRQSRFGPGEVQLQGDLGGWVSRLSPWINLEPWRLAGAADLIAKVEIGASAISTDSLQLVLTNLQATGPGWRVQEPKVTLETSGRYVREDGTIDLGETTLVGSSASLRARNTQIALSETTSIPRIRCEAAFLAALARIDAWRIGTDGRPLPVRLAGTAKGTVRIDEQPGGLRADCSATVSEFAVHEYVPGPGAGHPGYRPAWQEGELELAAKATYTAKQDQWDIEQAAIRSKSLAAALGGSISDVDDQCEANIRGTIAYDLADVGPLLAANLGVEMNMTGREQATFEVIGPLRPVGGASAKMVSTRPDPGAGQHWSKRLRGHVAAGWESIQVFGLPIGRGRIDAQLYDGELTLAPLDVPVGAAGRLTTSARGQLAPPPAQLVIASGPVVADVEITPEVSGKLLKYFIPSLADAIETEGKFSLATTGGRVPLEDPFAIEAAGTLTVHSAQVRPGRIGRDWILLAEQIEALLKSREVPQLSTRPQRDLMTFDKQTVVYRITGGRVYHENLVFMVGDIPVRSQGSVGFDHTLAIEIEVPVQDAWIEGKPQLARFKGQNIRGTIRGTLEKLDFGPLISDLARQVGQGLLEGAVENELNKALDRLLRPE